MCYTCNGDFSRRHSLSKTIKRLACVLAGVSLGYLTDDQLVESSGRLLTDDFDTVRFHHFLAILAAFLDIEQSKINNENVTRIKKIKVEITIRWTG